MYDAFLTDTHRQAVRNTVAADPDILLDRLAATLGIPEAAAAELLEPGMCTPLPAGTFESVWQAMTQWEKVTLITHIPGVILEIRGRIPPGTFARGFFNINDPDNPIAGHIKTEEIHSICLVSKPFMGLESHSVRFYRKSGTLLFAVYAGRNGKEMIPSVKEGFMALKQFAEQEVRP
jgi:heme iron utilization protein